MSYATLTDPARAGVALEHWRAATLARIGVAVPAANAPASGAAAPAQMQPFVPAGAMALPQAVRTTVQGQRPDGTPVTAHAAWFARALGSEVRVYHAVVFADKARPAVADTFFAGLELR